VSLYVVLSTLDPVGSFPYKGKPVQAIFGIKYLERFFHLRENVEDKRGK